MTSVIGINNEEAVPTSQEIEWPGLNYDFSKPYRDLLAKCEDICSTGDSSRAILISPLEEYCLCAMFPEKGPRLTGRIRLLQTLYRACDADGL